MKNSKPKVSVVTITYAHEKYIEDTLRGVLMQQYDGPVEFIIANDNSPDATDEVVKKYFLENPAPSNFEIKYTKHETNKGMMPNFIWALEQATGKYIALCEGDDYWIDPLKLQKQVDFLEENGEYVACQHHRVVLNDQGDEKIENYCDFIFTQCVLFRNIIDNYFTEFLNQHKIFNGDSFLEYYLKALGNYKYLDFIGAVYRYNGEGIFSQLAVYEKRMLGLDSFKKIYKFILETNYKNKKITLKEIRSIISIYLYHFANNQVNITIKLDVIKFYIKYKITGKTNFKRLIFVLLK